MTARTTQDSRPGEPREAEAVAFPRRGARRIDSFALVGRTNERLKSVLEMAQNMSLAAVNASATAVRAGDSAKGFIPITRSIDELAHDTTRLVRQITAELVELVFLSVAEYRSRKSMNEFTRAAAWLQAGTPHPAFEAARARICETAEREREALRSKTTLVLEMLGRISMQMRAARYISATALVEAASTDRYRSQLEVVAKSVSATADSIERVVSRCRGELQRPARDHRPTAGGSSR